MLHISAFNKLQLGYVEEDKKVKLYNRDNI
jgi:hypothetical protein